MKLTHWIVLALCCVSLQREAAANISMEALKAADAEESPQDLEAVQKGDPVCATVIGGIRKSIRIGNGKAYFWSAGTAFTQKFCDTNKSFFSMAEDGRICCIKK